MASAESDVTADEEDNEYVEDVFDELEEDEGGYMVLHMTDKERRVLAELKEEMREMVEKESELEEKQKKELTDKEAELREAQIQLGEAQGIEERLRGELARVVRDMEVLEQRDREIRNEVSTTKRQQQNQRQNELARRRDCRERLRQYLLDIKEKTEQRGKEKGKDKKEETEPFSSPQLSKGMSLEGLNIEKELECPICFELSRPPIYQCPEGHIICNDCRPKVSRCPVCRFVFQGTPDIRNRFIERLAVSYFSQLQ